MPINETIVMGGGCFWCLDAAYRLVKGISKVTSGYSGGHIDNPTYEQVTSGTTGHAEVVKVEFEPKTISLNDVLDIFWTIHDPTTLNRQGNDVGPQYRSVLFYKDQDQKQAFEKSKATAQKVWSGKIVTEIAPLVKFYPAEAYHQDYFKNHPEQAYCQIIINPKLAKLRKKFAALLKA
jgi:peptide-methionine (S)-S-oxide reductase